MHSKWINEYERKEGQNRQWRVYEIYGYNRKKKQVANQFFLDGLQRRVLFQWTNKHRRLICWYKGENVWMPVELWSIVDWSNARAEKDLQDHRETVQASGKIAAATEEVKCAEHHLAEAVVDVAAVCESLPVYSSSRTRPTTSYNL